MKEAKMYKVKNIFNEERGFETDGKIFVLKPKETIIVKNPPKEIGRIFNIELIAPEIEKKTAKKQIEEKKQKKEVKDNGSGKLV